MNNCVVKRKTIDIVVNNKLQERIECRYNEQGDIIEGNESILQLEGKRIYDENNNCIYIKSIVDSDEMIVTCDIDYYK